MFPGTATALPPDCRNGVPLETATGRRRCKGSSRRFTPSPAARFLMVAARVGRVTCLTAALLALTALPTQVRAQGGRATITGRVVSEADQPLAGANIGI